MIQIFNLYKVYPDNHPALTDINLHIKKGECWVIVRVDFVKVKYLDHMSPD